MKKLIYIITAILFLSATNQLNTQIGCMDNSWHLKKKDDHKEYHYVQCNCECHRYAQSFDRGKCSKCGHYHDPKEFNQAIESASQKNKSNYFDIKNMLKARKNKKK